MQHCVVMGYMKTWFSFTELCTRLGETIPSSQGSTLMLVRQPEAGVFLEGPVKFTI